MNYKLNFAALLLVFSVVTYNVCMAYQNLDDVNVHGKFQQIGLLETPHTMFVPPHKPAPPMGDENDELASIY